MTDESVEEPVPGATDLEQAAAGFEQSDEKTSPEVVAHRRRSDRPSYEPSNPVCVVGPKLKDRSLP